MLVLSQPFRATATNPSGTAAFGTIREFNQRRQWSEAGRFGGSSNTNYTPFEGINLDDTIGVDNFTDSTSQGARTTVDRNDRDLTLDLKASWDDQLQLTSQLVLGRQVLMSCRHTLGSFGQEFPVPGLVVTSAAVIQTATETILETVDGGLFAQWQPGLDDIYFLTGGPRYDKHST